MAWAANPVRPRRHTADELRTLVYRCAPITVEIKVDVVETVICVEAELREHALMNRKVLLQGQIPVEEFRSTSGVSSRVTDLIQRRIAETNRQLSGGEASIEIEAIVSGGVIPAHMGLQGSGASIRVARRIASTRSGNVGGTISQTEGERQAVSKRQHRAKLPASNDLIHPTSLAG